MHERVLDERPCDLQHPLLVADGSRAVSGDHLERPPVGPGNRGELVADRLCNSPRSTASRRTVSCPASARERSSSSVASLARRSTCSRIVARNSVRVSSSSSSSVISSRKPPSENTRRAKLVRGVGDELPPRVIERCEPLAHAVERPSELPDLVTALVADRLVEPPRSDSLSRALQPPQPPSEQERAEIAEAERDGERDARRRSAAARGRTAPTRPPRAAAPTRAGRCPSPAPASRLGVARSAMDDGRRSPPFCPIADRSASRSFSTSVERAPRESPTITSTVGGPR